ncbi:hypothetical protein BDZ85DRAFT_270142 [Elsinoe ampelina]|uniref:3-hydroxyacyl-CoA dehydrogenase n=1 Tax=Elsinoe ampelina TaxID=302913 RepID=A0A6A6FYI4_9PEZI|nr:hypothetical protein BDZ85DRAFT_270142 [Elsinoe ampelina]
MSSSAIPFGFTIAQIERIAAELKRLKAEGRLKPKFVSRKGLTLSGLPNPFFATPKLVAEQEEEDRIRAQSTGTMSKKRKSTETLSEKSKKQKVSSSVDDAADESNPGDKHDTIPTDQPTETRGMKRIPVPDDHRNRIAIIGCGTIGASFVTMHLLRNPDATVIVYDTRPDIKVFLKQHVKDALKLIDPSCSRPNRLSKTLRARLEFADSIKEAVSRVEIVQEQGPEKPEYKIKTWAKIEKYAHPATLLWTSTSGIPASVQAQKMKNPARLIVCHPFNPPLLMPLIEVVPGPGAPKRIIKSTMKYWRNAKKHPILINKEVPGFVANRLAFALLREAVSLVQDGVISVKDLDELVETSMGPRWAVAGPFRSYNAGGGAGGMEAFLKNIGGTIKESWKYGDEKAVKPESDGWEASIAEKCKEAFDGEDYEPRKKRLRRVLDVVGDEGEEREGE